MNRNRRIEKTFFALLTAMIALVAAEQEIDGIAAVIGDSIILRSEVNSIVDLQLQQSGNSDMLMRNMLYNQTLENMLDGMVLAVYATNDTNINISQSEVAGQVDNRINMIIAQNRITKEQLMQAIEREQGISFAEFQQQLSAQVKQELIRQKVQQFYLGTRDLTRDEVGTFFEEYKDSLPSAGESVRMQKIEVNFASDSTIRQNAYNTITTIRKKIVEENEDFSEMAKKYSKGPNASMGGDLGFIQKGTLQLIKLESQIFRLAPGEMSNPIETRMGFHLVKVTERQDKKVHALHIFIPVKANEEKMAQMQVILDSVRASGADKESFSKAVKEFSTDDVTKAYDGDMGWQLVSTLPTILRSHFSGNLKAGLFSDVYKEDNALFLYRIDTYEKNRPLNMSDDFDLIQRYANQIKNKDKLKNLVKGWYKDVYVKVF